MKAITILQPNGRVVIPAAIRQQLHLGAGHQLEITVQQGRIVLTPSSERLHLAQALLAEQAGDDHSRWSDELIAERRTETERD